MTVAVSLERLHRRFGDVVAVRSLTLDVRRGELFGIVGPDGAGKTTTLRMLAGVLPPTAGDAVVLGISVAGDPEAVKPRIAYMPQRFGLYQDLTVRENILFYSDLYGVPRAERAARMDRLYAFSRLGEFQHRLAGQLSGGMKQKLSLCCALVHQPDILLLDEPTFGVDPISRRDLWLILHEMVAGGTTALVSTSYLDEAERCDRVVLLDRGEMLAEDSPPRIQARLDGRIVVVHGPNPVAIRDVLAAAGDVASATLFGDAVHVVTRGRADAAAMEARLVQAGITADSVLPARPSMEDAFIDLVAGAAA